MKRDYQPRGIRVSRGFSHVALESHARALRVLLGLKEEPIDGLRLFDQISSIEGLAPYPVREAVEQLESGVEARTYFDIRNDEVVVSLSEMTYQRLEERNPRALFTVAHELGHVRLHLHEIIRLSSSIHPGLARGRSGHAPFEDSEWQADAYAAALLMPVEGLLRLHQRRALNAVTVAEHFGVSIEAANHRIDNYIRRLQR